MADIQPVNYALETLCVGVLEVNCYILADTASLKAFIIDPGGDAGKISAVIEKRKWTVSGIINTHGHGDHIKANNELKRLYSAPLYIHKDDSEFLSDPNLNNSYLIGKAFTSNKADELLSNGQKLRLGSLELKVIHTPGHTPGSICLQVEDLLFTGDTLFYGTAGRTDLPGGDETALMNSMLVFKDMNPDTRILPGHGIGSILREEFKHNPYLQGNFD